MKFNLKYTKNRIGEWFEFTIHDAIALPPENEPSLIIQDEEKYHFTIPVKHFKNYDFKTGQKWKFRLDSIDCDNNIVFEPKHPIYNEKSLEPFEVIGRKTIINELEIKEEIICIKDKIYNEGKIRLCSGIMAHLGFINARIEQIKQGQLNLLPTINNSSVFETGKKQFFKIISQKTLPLLGKSYLLKDNLGNLHPLPIDPYRHFSLKPGMTIESEIRKISSKGFLYLEPMHPLYKKGGIYRFEMLDVISDNQQSTGFVEDIFGNIIKVEHNQIIKGDFYNCRVLQIVKGLPVLEIVSEIS